MKVIFCGDRRWYDYHTIFDRMAKLPHDALIITGGADGADAIAELCAKDQGREPYLHVIPAVWEFGHKAGPIRNREMLAMEPDLVIAFHANYATSKGTRDCVEEAKRRGIPVEMIP